jgi:hypothetical protein
MYKPTVPAMTELDDCKIFCWTSGGIPVPVSEISMLSPFAPVVTVRHKFPPFGMQSIALLIRQSRAPISFRGI